MTPQRDETSAALYNGVHRALSRMRVIDESAMPVRGEARAPHASKRGLLVQALDHGGPGLLLALGRTLLGAESDPAIRVLRRATSPIDAVRRWQRLERFYHSRHRTTLLGHDEAGLGARHVASHGPAPGDVENLLIAGIFLALIEGSGARGIDARFGDGVPFARAGEPCLDAISETGESGSWRFSWDRVEARDLQGAASAPPDPEALEARLRAEFASDPARAWTVAELARCCGMSARTLQRRLEGAGTSMRTFLRDLRARHAARLLAESDDSLAQIGFASGYSDQAHFGREFKRCIGMPPGRYREML